jgi:hypothetical protein
MKSVKSQLKSRIYYYDKKIHYLAYDLFRFLIMRDCWMDAPNSRPSFSDLVQDMGRIVHVASGTVSLSPFSQLYCFEFIIWHNVQLFYSQEYLELEGMRPPEDIDTPPSSPENSASGMIMFDPEFIKSFS